jgi:hypothetical protein
MIKKRHRFLVKKAERTQLEYQNTEPDWTQYSGFRGVQLLYDGLPYQRLISDHYEETGWSDSESSLEEDDRTSG